MAMQDCTILHKKVHVCLFMAEWIPQHVGDPARGARCLVRHERVYISGNPRHLCVSIRGGRLQTENIVIDVLFPLHMLE